MPISELSGKRKTESNVNKFINIGTVFRVVLGCLYYTMKHTVIIVNESLDSVLFSDSVKSD